jgi:hypothetical protein
MFADEFCNEKQCYMFSVDQRYFAYYSLNSIHKKIFLKGAGKNKIFIIIFYPNIRAVFFSPRAM